MKKRTLSDIITEGLIHTNPLTARLVGLCPALFACARIDTAAAMGVCALITLVVTSVIVSLLNKLLTKDTGALTALFISCGVLSALQLLMAGLLPDMADKLGVYLPLLSVSGICHLYGGRIAMKNNLLTSAVSAFFGGVGYMGAMLAIAVIRQLLGGSVRLLASPAGAFICLGLLAALLRLISGRRRDGCDD